MLFIQGINPTICVKRPFFATSIISPERPVTRVAAALARAHKVRATQF